jgi:hypothetical protein
MKQIRVRRTGSKLEVGIHPKLVIDLDGGGNYIETECQKIPYRKNIRISQDLLQGKRTDVMQTVINHYYAQACDIAEGYKIIAGQRDSTN